MNEDVVKVLFALILCIFLITAGPCLAIWSMNTLFNCGIAYNFWTYLAVIILAIFLRGDVPSNDD